MRTLKAAIAIFFMGLFLAACGSDGGGGGGGGTTQQANTSAYYESDGICFRASTNSEEPDSRCNSLKYVLEDGECFDTAGKRQSNLSLCTRNQYFRGSRFCYNRSSDRVDEDLCDSTSDNNDDFDDFNGSFGYPRIKCDGFYQIDLGVRGIYVIDCDGRTGSGNCSGRIVYDYERGEKVECL